MVVNMENDKTESEKFDAVVRKMMSVPHDEIVRREKEWKRKRKLANKKRAKTSPASRASSGKG
jgi:hypothetical protein